jgi:hypothetical protein
MRQQASEREREKTVYDGGHHYATCIMRKHCGCCGPSPTSFSFVYNGTLETGVSRRRKNKQLPSFLHNAIFVKLALKVRVIVDG